MPMHQKAYRGNKEQAIYIRHSFYIFGIKQNIKNFGTDATILYVVFVL